MKYGSILLIIFLHLVVKPVAAQQYLSYYPKVDSIALDDAKKTPIDQFLKFHPTYKLVSCQARFNHENGSVEMFSLPELKGGNSNFLTMLGRIKKGDVVSFVDIIVMNGAKKTHLTPKAYVVK